MRRVIVPLEQMGATLAGRERPAAVDRARRGPARHRLHSRGAERPGQERRPAGRPAGGRSDQRPRAVGHPRPYRAGVSRPSAVEVEREGLIVESPRRTAAVGRDRSSCPATSRRRRSGPVRPRPLEGSALEIEAVGLNPSRTHILERAPPSRCRSSRPRSIGKMATNLLDASGSRAVREQSLTITPDQVPG